MHDIPPSHGLVAILLITRPKPGPKLVFYYPPEVDTQPRVALDNAHHVDSDDESDDDGYRNSARVRKETPDGVYDRLVSKGGMSGDASSASSKLFSHPIDSLERLLSPGRWCARKKFEITLDSLTFVGYPVYSREDGQWSTRAPLTDPQAMSYHGNDPYEDFFGESTIEASGITIKAPEVPSTNQPHDFAHVPDSLETGPSLATSFASNSTASASGLPVEEITMFQVVFVLRSNAQKDAGLLYEHVAKPLSRALQYCQRQSDYIAKESRKLLTLQSKAKQLGLSVGTLWRQMVDGSELAWALKEVYEKTSSSDVAGFRLQGMEMSLHVPVPPMPAEGVIPALVGDNGLLLLEEKDSLLHELSHPNASPLANFIREHTPTKTLQKLASRLNTPTPNVLALAQHLIKWRKARPISPLHSRNSYVVAPDAPLDKLPDLIPVYARKFAALPTLPQMLKVLSGRPIKYGLLIPSKDHRTPYMDILAFLLRHDLVMQLKTFGWLQAPKHVAENSDKGERKKRRPLSGISLLSPHLRPVLDDDAMSIDSAQTAVTTIPAAESVQAVSDPGADSAPGDEQGECPTLVFNPTNPTESDEEALNRILDLLENSELADRLPDMLGYFDGEHPLEHVAVAEGLKRAKLEEWLEILQGDGLLLTFRAL